MTAFDKAQAAIALKVPYSGIPVLDAMIRESRRLDMATAAIKKVSVPVDYMGARETKESYDGWTSKCFKMADALLAASGKEQMK